MPAKPKITNEVQFRIERMLLLWEGKLTWKSLTQKISIELGVQVSRQTLESYNGIYKAFKHKKSLGGTKESYLKKGIIKGDVDLLKRIEKLEVEIELKNKTINEQKRFLQRILQNATEIPALKGNLDLLIAERPEDK
jgi:hypothetical protein